MNATAPSTRPLRTRSRARATTTATSISTTIAGDSTPANPNPVPAKATTRSSAAPAIKLTGFGASAAFGAHVFKLRLPAGRAGQVELAEDFGYLAGLNGLPSQEIRAVFPRMHWSALADAARKDFNARLRERKAAPGSWNVGETLLDRMLGKELCVLLWAAEHAHAAQLPAICLKWSTLRPEERWWLYAMTAAQGGLAPDRDRGWRKALYHALSDLGESGGQGVLMDMPQSYSLFGSAR